VTITNAPRAPYALEPPAFPFPAFAAMAGRAPLGGQRELVLACFVVLRIVRDALSANGLSDEQQAVRVQGVRHWLGSAALPAQVRTSLQRLADATLAGDRQAMVAALESVTTVTASQLDSGARLELGRLAQAVAK